jgi:hypothetical protein
MTVLLIQNASTNSTTLVVDLLAELCKY